MSSPGLPEVSYVGSAASDVKGSVVRELVSKWDRQAILRLPAGLSHPAPEYPMRATLAELIKLVLETLPQPMRQGAHIECGDMVLGYDAISQAYRSAYFPLAREVRNLTR